jgi:hypothetical protein
VIPNGNFDDLSDASIGTLRALWAKAHGLEPPEGLGRELLTRGIAWKWQADQHGGLSRALRAELDRLAGQLHQSGELDVERQTYLKAGTRLVREWQGPTCHVTDLRDGFKFNDKRNSSQSEIARAITGTRWSGPRFFSLRQRPRAPLAEASR